MEKKMNARKKAQRAARLRKQRNRRIALTLCLMFVVAFASIGGTIAWLTANSGPVVNTFTAGDITIDLNEHAYDPATNTLTNRVVKANDNYKIVPGVNLPKDPYVTVGANSEACWLFVQITPSANWSNKMTYSVDTTTTQNGAVTPWKPLQGVNNVYYMQVDATTAEKTFTILNEDDDDNSITVSNQITKGEIIDTPTLTFTAYACQQAGRTVTEAWDVVKPTT